MAEDRDLVFALLVTFAIVGAILGLVLVANAVALARYGGLVFVAILWIAVEFTVAFVSHRRWPWVDPRTPIFIVAGVLLSVSAFLPLFEAEPVVRFMTFLLGVTISIVGIATRNL